VNFIPFIICSNNVFKIVGTAPQLVPGPTAVISVMTKQAIPGYIDGDAVSQDMHQVGPNDFILNFVVVEHKFYNLRQNFIEKIISFCTTPSYGEQNPVVLNSDCSPLPLKKQNKKNPPSISYLVSTNKKKKNTLNFLTFMADSFVKIILHFFNSTCPSFSLSLLDYGKLPLVHVALAISCILSQSLSLWDFRLPLHSSLHQLSFPQCLAFPVVHETTVGLNHF
jgi:hypothetical protein